MSTYWGFHCKTCLQDDVERGEYDYTGAYSETWANHGEDALRTVAKLTPHLAVIRETDTGGWIQVEMLGYGSAPISWVMEHAGHDIELHNEYGKVEPL